MVFVKITKSTQSGKKYTAVFYEDDKKKNKNYTFWCNRL